VGTGTGITVGPVLGSGVASVGVGAGAGFFFVVGAVGFGARLVVPLPGTVVAPVPGFVALVLGCVGMLVPLADSETLGVATAGVTGGTVFWP
jgi:hypothetical protein